MDLAWLKFAVAALGVATLPPSITPSETPAFYFINRPPMPNILVLSVHYLFLTVMVVQKQEEHKLLG